MVRCPECHYVTEDNNIEICPHCIHKAKMVNVDNVSIELIEQYKKDIIFYTSVLGYGTRRQFDNSYVPPTEDALRLRKNKWKEHSEKQSS